MELKKGLFRIDEILWELLDDDRDESDKILLQEGRGLIHTLVKNLALSGVVKSLPTLEEANIELKDFVETYYTEKETTARLECAIGFKHCYRWLSKILTK